MKELYIVRHGQTDWNVAGMMQGRTDIPLNQSGKDQAGALANYLQAVPIEVTYASPLVRAYETAATINQHFDHVIIKDERLIERGFGTAEGKSFQDYIEPQTNELVVEDAEPMHEVRVRVFDFLKDIIAGDAKHILCVSHGISIQTLFELLGAKFSLDKKTQGVVFHFSITPDGDIIQNKTIDAEAV